MSLYLGENLVSGVAYPVEPSRNIGQIIQSTIPLTDAGLHLLDGSLILGGGIYADFVSYMADVYTNTPRVEKSWIQPVLSADGTLGGDSFAVSASAAYDSSSAAWHAFDNNSSTKWNTGSYSYPQYLVFYNPIALKVSKLTVTNRADGNAYVSAGNIYGSDDNSTWTLITTFTNSTSTSGASWDINLSSNTNFYKYYKFEITNGNFSASYNISLAKINITATYQECPVFCTESDWQTSVTTYGVCGKFVYDSVNNTVRLPKITGITEATTDVTTIGDLIEQFVRLPNITAYWRSSQDYTQSGAAYRINSGQSGYGGDYYGSNTGFDASRISSVYSGNGTDTKIQPQAIKVLYYIVVATSTKTDIQVDIDEIATDLNGKADVDLSNCTKPHIVETYINGTSWYRVYSDGWCEQGGYIGSGSGNATVTLLKPYKDTNYYANGCAITNNTGLGSDGNVGVKTTTTCSFVNNAYTYPMLWECKGYINTGV